MTQEERERMNRLVLLIQDEKDHSKFTALVDELNELMDRKESRFAKAENRKADSEG